MSRAYELAATAADDVRLRFSHHLQSGRRIFPLLTESPGVLSEEQKACPSTYPLPISRGF